MICWEISTQALTSHPWCNFSLAPCHIQLALASSMGWDHHHQDQMPTFWNNGRILCLWIVSNTISAITSWGILGVSSKWEGRLANTATAWLSVAKTMMIWVNGIKHQKMMDYFQHCCEWWCYVYFNENNENNVTKCDSEIARQHSPGWWYSQAHMMAQKLRAIITFSTALLLHMVARTRWVIRIFIADQKLVRYPTI